MENTLECTMEIKKYFKKLTAVLNNEPVFSFFKTKLYNKARIDDVVCCVEGSFPEQYRALIKNKQARKLKSYQIYFQLMLVLKAKFALAPSLYKVNKVEADTLIKGFLANIDSDVRFIMNNPGGMY